MESQDQNGVRWAEYEVVKILDSFLKKFRNFSQIDKKMKRKIYEEIFDYVYDINKYFERNLKDIFYIAAKETIIQINNELKEGNFNMLNKIKIIIADDNVHICKFIKEYSCKYNG